jgi:hypothetical protein
MTASRIGTWMNTGPGIDILSGTSTNPQSTIHFIIVCFYRARQKPKTFLGDCSWKKKVSLEEAALSAAQYAGFFLNSKNRDVLHSVSENLRRTLPKSSRFQKLDETEIAQIRRALALHVNQALASGQAEKADMIESSTS